jgi:hypothetical protein
MMLLRDGLLLTPRARVVRRVPKAKKRSFCSNRSAHITSSVVSKERSAWKRPGACLLIPLGIILGGTQRKKQEQWEWSEMLHDLLQYSPDEKMTARGLSGGFRSGERLVNGSPAQRPLFS